MTILRQPAWLTVALLAAACGPSIEDLDLDDDGTGGDTGSDDTGTDDTGTDDTGTDDTGTDDTGTTDGSTVLQIDASANDVWVYVDLESGTTVSESDDWSLAFQRFNVIVNGGISGDGDVEAVWIDEAYANVTEAPIAGWATDMAAADTDSEDTLVFGAWYDYDVTTHALSPAAGTWAVRGLDGATYKLVFTTYYDNAGTSGFPTIRFEEIEDPDRGITKTIDASDAQAPVYIVLEDLSEITAPGDPSTALDWDLSIARTVFKLNGGWNGSGMGEAYTYPDGTAWGDVSEAPTSGWEDDVEPPSQYESGTALGTWFDYDTATHAVSPSGRIHAVRDAAGDTWKFTVTDWDDGMVTVRVAALAEAT